jgi:small-conductance mechanosensitive channel
MEQSFQRQAGLMLILGSFLLVVTMILHPTGDSMEQILKIRKVIISAHVLAIFSMPFVAFGFYGLAQALLSPRKTSLLAFFFAVMSILAGMIAGAVNGLATPFFVMRNADRLNENRPALEAAIRYGFSLNWAMDYIFIGCVLFAIGIWSVQMVSRRGPFPAWLGYFGLLLLAASAFGVISGFNFINLFGFRVFIFSLVGWIGAAGVLMMRSSQELKSAR